MKSLFTIAQALICCCDISLLNKILKKDLIRLTIGTKLINAASQK
ncbi:hypothetical protein AVDCRST_MAG94-5869 [uncultured Leptolyngbya sp.]|uniref:Uncharacterized protein n=1 Tax=uncultured Leptolyngbya sp. TaxID=332963 RepID=A0A6J4P3Y5_9CYAN|nr:hypothetical protein AVDCRST_MAG94-5869 [uncultured Leptolyngbya sp.]